MPYDFISVTSSDEATTIVLTRPQVLNAIHPAMHLELQDAFDRFAADRAQRICVLRENRLERNHETSPFE